MTDCYILEGRCTQHGGTALLNSVCRTSSVLQDVAAERARQFATYGTNENIKDGTGRAWLFPLSQKSPAAIEAEFRENYEAHETVYGAPTWVHLVREEVAEAFAETDPDRLREELLQVAALCVSWVEKIDQRTGRNLPSEVFEALTPSERETMAKVTV